VVETNLKRANEGLRSDLIAAVSKKMSLDPDQPQTDAYWAFEVVDIDAQEQEWSTFKHTLQSRSRFFNLAALKFLDDLFKPLETMKAGGFFDMGPITVLAAGRHMFRARRVNTSSELAEILSDIPAQVSAPPPNKTPAGRMNIERMPAFYAAFDEKTAIAETRPMIGNDVITAKFRTTRALKMLDCSVLPRSSAPTFSIWNEKFAYWTSLRGILRGLQNHIARPVMPGEAHEYLYTQFISEYLFEKRGIEALAFKSVQYEGRNIVILNGALGLYDMPTQRFPNLPFEFVRGSDRRHTVSSIELTTTDRPAVIR
jgi:hypothetical protein